MCDDGLMASGSRKFGMHSTGPGCLGQTLRSGGPFFAATDLPDIEIEGLGGHAAKYNETVDPTVIASDCGRAAKHREPERGSCENHRRFDPSFEPRPTPIT
jgi:metal-dependent amidase/aminoacylase/carboxypeptidase family protein